MNRYSQYGQCIKDIKALIENHLMSFIVGAGFSRNVSEAFPMWPALLRPMAEELYGNGWDTGQGSGHYADKTYLDIASEYVRRKGYHEAIDWYVEQHVPYLQRNNDGEYELFRAGFRLDEKPDLTCHKALLAMGVKDIYTFNYDNALESVGDVDKSNELRRALQEDRRMLKHLQAQCKDYQECYDSFLHADKMGDASLAMDGNMQTQEWLRSSNKPFAEVNDYAGTVAK